MFEALANSWGKFIKLDYLTMMRERFDQMLVLVEVSSKSKIPPIPQVQIKGKTIKLRASIVDMEKVEVERHIMGMKKAK